MINVRLFNQEIGRLGMENKASRFSFQYNPEFLQSGEFLNIFPKTGLLKRTEYVQTFNQLPSQIADSLPDKFGSVIFKVWLGAKEISVLEQLAYIGKRGMGALEFYPEVNLEADVSIDFKEITEILKNVLDLKKTSQQKKLDHQSLVNIFKIGTSAGGARPKILISEHKQTGKIVPGDLVISDNYDHYLVKLALEEGTAYPREVVEFCYYRIMVNLGIRMMESKLIEGRHFATLRFDRKDGEKKHVLTASGITGWDFEKSDNSSYENLFKLCSFLKIPHIQMEELYKRMIFNVVFGNTDDHLKNHSFIYDKVDDSWELSPAYDITYALNPLLNFRISQRALSINGKRSEIVLEDVLAVAERYTIKNPKGIITEIQLQKGELLSLFSQHKVPQRTSKAISARIINLV